VIALRFVESIYRGALLGLQLHVWYNGANAVLATLRYGCVVWVLATVSPTVQAFFLWQAVISLLSVVVLAASVYGALPTAPHPARFSLQVLAGVWTFAGTVMGIAFVTLLQTQVDKLMLSRLLPLESFGQYALAATIAGALYVVVVPVTQGIYPRMVQLFSQKDQAGLVSLDHQAAQLVTVLTAPAVGVLSLFAGGVIFTWSGNASLSEATAPLLTVLALGNFLNCLLWVPYQLQFAHGWTILTLKVASAATVMLILCIFWIVPHYGAVGAAWTWLALNAGYFLIDSQLIHRRLIPKEEWRWYLGDVIIPSGGASAVLILAQQFQPASYRDRWEWAAFLLITGGVALVASIASAGRIRLWVSESLQSLTRLR
jgi:O-antigen/teichoic acid export membrane protein